MPQVRAGLALHARRVRFPVVSEESRLSIEAPRPRCTVTTTNRENRRGSSEFQREENNRRPCCADNGVPAVADNRGRYQLDLVG